MWTNAIATLAVIKSPYAMVLLGVLNGSVNGHYSVLGIVPALTSSIRRWYTLSPSHSHGRIRSRSKHEERRREQRNSLSQQQ